VALPGQLPGQLQIPGGDGELSAESQAAIENLVDAIASLEQASSEWEDFSERLIDAVGLLHKLNSVDQQRLKGTWFQPLKGAWFHP
jgi:hypothetical protein